MDVRLKCGRANSGVFAAKTGSQRNAAPVWECDRHAQFLHPSTEYEVDTFTVHSQRSFLQDFAAILQFDGHGRDDLSPNVEGFLLVCLLMIEGGPKSLHPVGLKPPPLAWEEEVIKLKILEYVGRWGKLPNPLDSA